MNFSAYNIYADADEDKAYSSCTDINGNCFTSYPSLNKILIDASFPIITSYQPYGLTCVNGFLFVCDTVYGNVYCYDNTNTQISSFSTNPGPNYICSDWSGDKSATTFNLYITHVETNVISYITFDTSIFFTNLQTYDTTIYSEISLQVIDITYRQYNSYKYLYLTTGQTYIKQIDISNLNLLNPLIPYTVKTQIQCSIISNTIQYYNNNFYIANSTDGIYMQSINYNSNTGLILTLNVALLIIAGGSTTITNYQSATAQGQQISALGFTYFYYPGILRFFIGTSEGQLIMLESNNPFYASIIYSGTSAIEYTATDTNLNVYGSIPPDNNKIIQITNDGNVPTSETDIIVGLPFGPRGMVLINNFLFISDNSNGNLAYFDLNNIVNGQTLILLTGQPHGICTDWDGQSSSCNIYVANEGASIISSLTIGDINNIANTIIQNSDIAINIDDCITEGITYRKYNNNGYLYCTTGNSIGNAILQIDLSNNNNITQLTINFTNSNSDTWAITNFDESFYIGYGVAGGIEQFTINNYNFGTGLIYAFNNGYSVIQSGETTITNGLVSTDQSQYISSLGMSYNYNIFGLNLYVGTTDGYIVKLSYSNDYSCFGYNTDIIMADLTSKRICDIKENDEILEDRTTNKTSKVVKVSKQFVKNYGYKLEKDLIGNTKDIYCTNHPIWCNNGENRIFPSDIQGSERVQIKEYMYDILFENEGTFYANNIKVDSLPPLKDYKYDGEDDPIRQKPKMTFLFDGIDKFE